MKSYYKHFLPAKRVLTSISKREKECFKLEIFGDAMYVTHVYSVYLLLFKLQTMHYMSVNF